MSNIIKIYFSFYFSPFTSTIQNSRISGLFACVTTAWTLTTSDIFAVRYYILFHACPRKLPIAVPFLLCSMNIRDLVKHGRFTANSWMMRNVHNWYSFHVNYLQRIGLCDSLFYHYCRFSDLIHLFFITYCHLWKYYSSRLRSYI